MNRLIRQVLGCGRLLCWLVIILADYAASMGICLGCGADRVQSRARWLQRSCRRLAWALGVRVTISSGQAPLRGIVASNHLSYVDIAVLGAVAPMVFISKAEVRGWPILGPLTQLAGTLFVDRTSRADTARLQGDIERAAGAGLPVVFFPEGTSSDGRDVLPFKTSFFESAVRSGLPVNPAGISYHLPGGESVADEVCYWRDMVLLPHLLNLLSLEKIEASIAFGEPLRAGASDRKDLARRAHREVCRLRASAAPSQPGATSTALAHATASLLPVSTT